MIEQASAKIFLSAERGHNESVAFRSYSTFNFGKYFNSNKEAFGALYVLNDDTIAGGCSAKMVMDRDCYIVFIPLVGGIDYSDSMGDSFYISAGEVFMLHAPRGLVIALTNPYEDAMVNYLHLRVDMKAYTQRKIPFIFSADLEAKRNNFTEIISPVICRDPVLPFAISLARLDGRTDALYTLRDAFATERGLRHDAMGDRSRGALQRGGLAHDADRCLRQRRGRQCPRLERGLRKLCLRGAGE